MDGLESASTRTGPSARESRSQGGISPQRCSRSAGPRWLIALGIAFALVWTGSSRSAGLQDGQPGIRIKVRSNVRVSARDVPHVEPYIAANPVDPRNLVVSASVVIPGKGSLAQAYFSLDGGLTWSTSTLPGLREESLGEVLKLALDCWVAYAPGGDAYYSTLANEASTDRGDELAVLVYRSDDGGKTWRDPARIRSGSLDRPAIVTAGTAGDPRVLVAAIADGRDRRLFDKETEAVGVAVFGSDDRGVSFKLMDFIATDHLGHGARNPLILADGSFLVPYVEFPARPEHRLISTRIYAARSGGWTRPFGLPHLVADVPLPNPGTAHFAADLSRGKFRGRVYAAWNGGDAGSHNVSVAYSTDNGETWSRPVVLGSKEAGSCWFAALAIPPDGTLGAAWVQDERDKSRSNCYRVYFAASLDGGATFGEPQAVSDAVSCPDSPQNIESRCPV